MNLPLWMAKLFIPASPQCDTLNIPPALFQKWMREVAAERQERAKEPA